MVPDYYRHISGTSLALSIFLIVQTWYLQINSECNHMFVSQPGNSSRNGTFQGPPFFDNLLSNQSRQCLYLFQAVPGQRVQIIFTSFNLRGTPPECTHEYLDIYTEINQSDPMEIINSPFGGRYCGPIAPRRRISFHQTIALSFFTDKNFTDDEPLFAGHYSFIDGSEYQIGNPIPNSQCSFLVNATKKGSGTMQSYTYPGAYPKAMNCTYQFIGKPGQRVRLEFRDFDVFYGGGHCPFDFVKVYDGIDNNSRIIGTYCGQQRNLVLYSSESTLFVLFSTYPRDTAVQNRGFRGIFEFAESFVKLDFISKNEGEHILGSECDQKILSKKESVGYVFSPNFPFPYIPKIVCRYFIYGMQDYQNLERVRLEFEKFDIPLGERNDADPNKCTDGYLKIYLKGQEVTESYDKYDYEFCNKDLDSNNSMPIIVSEGPRFVMVFSSGELQGGGFKAKYTFQTDYKIPGTASPKGDCLFTYRSEAKNVGEFNSPRHPANYPSNTNCTYYFYNKPNEKAVLIFENFKIRSDSSNTTFGSYGAHNCREDWIEISNLYLDESSEIRETLIGRYCGLSSPGPIETELGAIGLKAFFHTNSDAVYNGFKAKYVFEPAKSADSDCNRNFNGLSNGVINTPNFPQNYDVPKKHVASKSCNWSIRVKPNHKVLLIFTNFTVEGDSVSRGCSAAVTRIWVSQTSPPTEICGENLFAEQRQFISVSNVLRITFINADKSVGSTGFRAIWTEISDEPGCEEFICQKNAFCISSMLKCNNEPNCGLNDDSDEADCGTESVHEDSSLFIAVMGMTTIIVILIITVWCYRKSKGRSSSLASPNLSQLPSTSNQSYFNTVPLAYRTRYYPSEIVGQRFANV